MGAYLASFSDYVLGAAGVPVAGASVSLYATRLFAPGVLPSGGSPGVAASAAASSDATGLFSFSELVPDDYHLLTSYVPPGGAAVVVWRYNLSIHAVEGLRRLTAAHRSALLPLTMARLMAGQNVTIGCLGDDTTVGYNATGTVTGGWVALLALQLAALFPHATIRRADPTSYAATVDAAIPSWSSSTVQSGSGQTITVINAGVRGDTTLRVVRRLVSFYASWNTVDCLLLQLGQAESLTGQTQQFEQPADLASHLESLVNSARTLSTAELVLLTPAVSSNAAIDDYANAVRAVAARTHCDLVDLRQLFLDAYLSGGANGGYDPYLNTAISLLYPTDAGHAAIAFEIARHFTPWVNLPYSGAPFGSSRILELARLPYSSKQLVYVGSGWAIRSGIALAALNSSGGATDYATGHVGDTLTLIGRSPISGCWAGAGPIAASWA